MTTLGKYRKQVLETYSGENYRAEIKRIDAKVRRVNIVRRQTGRVIVNSVISRGKNIDELASSLKKLKELKEYLNICIKEVEKDLNILKE